VIEESRICQRCGKPVVLTLLGPSAPVVCEACSLYERQKQNARALAGSPSETAYRREIHLPEMWKE
jgi:NMD protein affecting ribosome stability and mRNA decay